MIYTQVTHHVVDACESNIMKYTFDFTDIYTYACRVDTIYYHIRHKPSVKNDLELAWKALPVASKLKFDDCQLFELYVRVNKNSAFFKALESQMKGGDLITIEAFFLLS